MHFLYRYRFLILAVIILLFCFWRFSPYSPRVFMPSYLDDGFICPQLPLVSAGNEPLSSDVPKDMQPIVLPKVKLIPSLGLSVPGRILDRKRYLYDNAADISTFDWMIGWDFMGNKKALKRVRLKLNNRGISFKGSKGEPLDYSINDIFEHTNYMHLVPANKKIATQINKIQVGDNVQVDGWVIRAETAKWVTNTSVNGDGGGYLLVCRVARLSPQKVWPIFK